MTEKHPMTTQEKLTALRRELARRGLGGFIVPRTDEYQNEYVPACAERLAWLTGFTGSAGTALILGEKAMVMTDGRYTVQIRQEIDADLFAAGDFTKTPPQDWLADNAAAGVHIGYDPRLHTPREIETMTKALKVRKIGLEPVETNPVDAVWSDRPAAPASPVEIFPDAVAGQSAAGKRGAVAASVAKAAGHAVILSSPQSVSWMLNIRATDTPHVPLALSTAIVRADGTTDWFIAPARVDDAVRAHIGEGVAIREPDSLPGALAELARASLLANKPVLLDYARTPLWFRMKIENARGRTDDMADPCIMPRACKTPTERASIVAAHVRDGVAMARFLKWIDDEAPKGSLTELSVEDALHRFRSGDPSFRDTSFDTIAGWAEHGAIVHYRATEKTNARVVPPGVFLIDSGAQYEWGTTDITRTVAVGDAPVAARENFTRVLKGHIAVATARFPEGTAGAQIDALARKSLWDAGLDYDHGTGHGVGCYLSVHEDAARISKTGAVPFKPGMLISNEPGYYEEDAYGIRIENLVFVVEDGARTGTDIKMLAFETVTLAPIDRRMIVKSMLNDSEIAWLDSYHARVFKTLAPLVEDDVKAWLEQATAPI